MQIKRINKPYPSVEYIISVDLVIDQSWYEPEDLTTIHNRLIDDGVMVEISRTGNDPVQVVDQIAGVCPTTSNILYYAVTPYSVIVYNVSLSQYEDLVADIVGEMGIGEPD